MYLKTYKLYNLCKVYPTIILKTNRNLFMQKLKAVNYFLKWRLLRIIRKAVAKVVGKVARLAEKVVRLVKEEHPLFKKLENFTADSGESKNIISIMNKRHLIVILYHWTYLRRRKQKVSIYYGLGDIFPNPKPSLPFLPVWEWSPSKVTFLKLIVSCMLLSILLPLYLVQFIIVIVLSAPVRVFAVSLNAPVHVVLGGGRGAAVVVWPVPLHRYLSRLKLKYPSVRKEFFWWPDRWDLGRVAERLLSKIKRRHLGQRQPK